MVAARRTSISPKGGALANAPFHELAAMAANAVMADANVTAEQIDGFFLGNALRPVETQLGWQRLPRAYPTKCRPGASTPNAAAGLMPSHWPWTEFGRVLHMCCSQVGQRVQARRRSGASAFMAERGQAGKEDATSKQ